MLAGAVHEQGPASCGHPAMLTSAAGVRMVASFRSADQEMRNQLGGARATEFQIQGHKSFHIQSKLKE